MARGSFNVTPVLTRWWRQDGRRRWISYFILPAVVAALVFKLDRTIDDSGAILTGSIFFAGVLFSIMFQVHGWSEDAAAAFKGLDEHAVGASWERERHQRRLKAVGRLYDSLTWATLVSLVLVVALVVMNTEAADAQRDRNMASTAVVLGFVGTHLLVVLLAVVNRLFIVTRSTVDQHQATPDRSTKRT